MHSVKYAIIQCAKGPFASDSISMNVVLSSNTAYRDQFSGRTRFSSLLEKARAKKKRRRYPIPVLSARRTQPQIRSSIRAEYVVFENVFLLRLATIFPTTSRRTSPIMRLLLDVYPSPRIISSQRSSRNYPPRDSFRPLRDPGLVDRTDRTGIYSTWPLQRWRRCTTLPWAAVVQTLLRSAAPASE